MDILFLTDTDTGHAAAAPAALDLLPHLVRPVPQTVVTLTAYESPDVILLDARRHLADARASSARLRPTRSGTPMLAVMSESGLATLSTEWAIDGVVLASAGPAELDARLRLAVGRGPAATTEAANRIEIGGLIIDRSTFAVHLDGRPLSLTLKELELLKLLAGQPDRVFSRHDIGRHVWGPHYRDDTRTIDVHIRRLRAKLGPDNEALIVTVRRVGYKFTTEPV